MADGVRHSVAEAMPHYPLDAAFADALPDELVPFWQEWKERREGS